MSADVTSLGATIRSWRERLTPAAVGLPARRSRRAPGLRREELAELADLSVDYVVRLEQGRSTTPSAQVAGALARALHLNRHERDHLYRLAGLGPPDDSTITEHIPPGIQRVIQRVGETPVAVFAADWRLLWWNRSWASLLGDPAAVPEDDRSLVRARFPVNTDGGRPVTWPVTEQDPEASDRAIIADLRRASARYPGDPGLARLLRRTIDGNPRFAQLWREGAVGTHSEDRKTIRHPAVGSVTVDCDVLTDADTDIKIVIYTTVPGSEDATKLDLTRVSGIIGAPGTAAR
ncbi:helix-turn-helix transcriptional regulator [Streptomyces niveus]|uniref:helix-turn-helix transcriptional regulator n=1 Tax=Streptomyces niveus TaxID=193462 RepID=UPI0004CEE88A|nr:helix-turn-helix transcriptional regulator [Streptomyces niveus]